MRLALVLNYNKPANIEFARGLCRRLSAMGFQLLMPQNSCGYTPEECADADFSGADMVLTMGGDGTLLAVCRYFSALNIPVLSVNLGKMGFLSEVEPAHAEAALGAIRDGRFFIEERTMLQASICRDGTRLVSLQALNDFVVGADIARSVFLDLNINGEPVYGFNADGIIVSSPTGSTAYSLSAGGPLLMPETEAMLVTPVCPHSFIGRPIVVPPDTKIQISFRASGSSCRLTADGQRSFPLFSDDIINISASAEKLRMVRLGKQRFFNTLNRKFFPLQAKEHQN